MAFRVLIRRWSKCKLLKLYTPVKFDEGLKVIWKQANLTATSLFVTDTHQNPSAASAVVHHETCIKCDARLGSVRVGNADMQRIHESPKNQG